MKNPAVQQIATLLRRETWEHRIAIFWVPLTMAALIIVIAVWGQLAADEADGILRLLRSLETLPEADRERSALAFFGTVSLVFLTGLLITVPFYLLASLYEDRKAGSSLFWYSMPISNTTTVLSKLLTGLLVMPLWTALTMLGLFLILLLIAAAFSLLQGIDLPVMMLLGGILDWVFIFIIGVVLISLWLLPLYGWLLLVSAFARAAPAFWAIAVVIGLNVLERVVLGTSYLATWLKSRSIPYESLTGDRTEFIMSMISYDLVYGIVIGSVFIVGAIYMRRFTD